MEQGSTIPTRDGTVRLLATLAKCSATLWTSIDRVKQHDAIYQITEARAEARRRGWELPPMGSEKD